MFLSVRQSISDSAPNRADARLTTCVLFASNGSPAEIRRTAKFGGFALHSGLARRAFRSLACIAKTNGYCRRALRRKLGRASDQAGVCPRGRGL